MTNLVICENWDLFQAQILTDFKLEYELDERPGNEITWNSEQYASTSERNVYRKY